MTKVVRLSPKEMMVGKFEFKGNAEIVRRAGSDWLKDQKDKLRKLRSWNAAEGNGT